LPPKPPETKEAAAHAETEVVESGNNRNTEEERGEGDRAGPTRSFRLNTNAAIYTMAVPDKSETLYEINKWGILD
jgi:hypothetical protein